MGWIRTTGLGIAALLSVGVPLFAQEDTVTRWHDLRALQGVNVDEPEGVDMNLHLQTAYLDNLEPDGWDVPLEERRWFRSEDWADWVRGALGEALGDALEDGSVEPWPGKLRVTGSERLQRRVTELLGELKAHLLRPVELEIFVLSAGVLPAGTAAVLSAEEVDALVAGAELLDYSRQSARLGQRLRLGSKSRRAVMMDYDVEVATKGRVADPQVTVLREGTAVGAMARARLGGGFFLRVWGRRGFADDPPRRLTLGHFAGAPLELPAMTTTLIAASAAIPDGGGVLVGQDWNEDGVWLVRAKHSGSAPEATDRRSRFVPLGELAARPMVIASPWLPQTDPSGGWGYVEDYSLAAQLGKEAREPVCEPEELVFELREERDRLELGGELLLLDDFLYVRDSAALLELCAHRVKRVSEELAQETVELDVRYGLLERSAARQLVTSKAAEEIAGELEHRLLGACRLGDTLLVLGGKEHFYLVDHDVEIAEAAAIPDPIIGNRFEGVSFWCRPSRLGEGMISALVELELQTAAGETTNLPVVTWEPREPEQDDDDPAPAGTFELTSFIELPSTARADVRSLVQLAEGEWTLLCCTGLAGTEQSLVAVVRAR